MSNHFSNFIITSEFLTRANVLYSQKKIRISYTKIMRQGLERSNTFPEMNRENIKNVYSGNFTHTEQELVSLVTDKFIQA